MLGRKVRQEVVAAQLSRVLVSNRASFHEELQLTRAYPRCQDCGGVIWRAQTRAKTDCGKRLQCSGGHSSGSTTMVKGIAKGPELIWRVYLRDQDYGGGYSQKDWTVVKWHLLFIVNSKYLTHFDIWVGHLHWKSAWYDWVWTARGDVIRWLGTCPVGTGQSA